MGELNSTERLLGTLTSEVESLKRALERVERELREQRIRWEKIENEIRTDIQDLRDFTIEIKGGRKALYALLGVAATLGGLLWEILQRFIPLK